MQIVIDIPEEEYALCKKQWDTECLDTLMIAVKYGTSLPKGHGRLIILSEDAVKKEYTSLGYSCQSWISDVGLSNATVAIIEADKSNEERDGKIQEVKVYEERITSYEAGYNDAKREIALSGEYERAYERGKADAQIEKWISITERLPKIADVYRVTRYCPKNVMNPNYYVDACFFDGSNWYNDNRINHERAYASNIIAWQENPEPYEPQKGAIRNEIYNSDRY